MAISTLKSYAIATCFLVCLFDLTSTSAQVSNDSCLSAMDLDTINGTSAVLGCFWGGPNFMFVDSTSIALANFPYPQIPFPCSGYNPNPMPSNDIWYKFYAKCEIEFSIIASDSIHLSFWYGPNCANLYPLNCYTIASGQSYTGPVPVMLPDTFELHWVQIAGTSVGVNSHFTLCLSAPELVCSNTSYYTTTNLLCFDYSIMKSDCSSPASNDGTAEIVIKQGNEPYTCLWNDGDTSFVRTGLSPGNYYVSIVDVNGCSETDSITISTINSVNLISVDTAFLVLDIVSNCFMISFPNQHGVSNSRYTLLVYDELGRREWEYEFIANSANLKVCPNKRFKQPIIYAILCNSKRDIISREILIIN